MAYKFNCEHCGKELIVHFLKIGELALCKNCNKNPIIPESAEVINVPFSPPDISRKIIDEQKERTRIEILRSPSVRIVKWVLDIVWYIGLIFFSLTIIGEIILGPNGTFYSDPTIELPIRVFYEDNIEFEKWAGLEYSYRADGIELVGHSSSIYRMPGGSWPASVAIDMIISVLFVLGATFFLRRIFKSILSGIPFSEQNSLDLRYVGYIIALWGPIYGTLNFIQGGYYLPYLGLSYAKTSVQLHWYPKLIVVGMVIVAISHMFEIASRMQQESDLTV